MQRYDVEQSNIGALNGKVEALAGLERYEEAYSVIEKQYYLILIMNICEVVWHL